MRWFVPIESILDLKYLPAKDGRVRSADFAVFRTPLGSRLRGNDDQMNIDIIGAGPAGLYFAILAKKSDPAARVVVTERNQADDTFGFGIVLSDETLGNLKRADEPTYHEIAAQFAYWDDIHTHFRGTVSRSSGHGFSGIRRLTLLQILQRRAAEVGVEVRYGVVDGGVDAHGDADLIVAADGINSAVRESLRSRFAPTVDLRSNRFTWLGARMRLPGFTYSFREDTISPKDGAHKPGIWNMHAYEYTKPRTARNGRRGRVGRIARSSSRRPTRPSSRRDSRRPTRPRPRASSNGSSRKSSVATRC